MNPTKDTYADLQKYYDLFNKKFFDNKLPNCLITYQRGKSYMAYYCYKRFSKSGDFTDEIAINPNAFKSHDKAEILSALLHEMVHLEQFHFGEPSRGGYHNREWAELMKKRGLQPFGVGRDYGKETGQSLNHKIIPGELFDQFLKEDQYNFELWVDTSKEEDIENSKDIKNRMLEVLKEQNYNENFNGPEFSKDVIEMLEKKRLEIQQLFDLTKEDAEKLAREKGSKMKYICSCGNRVWGKTGIKMVCLDCKATFAYEL